MHSFCLLTSEELIAMPNCSLLKYLHSNDMNSLKSALLIGKKVIASTNLK